MSIDKLSACVGGTFEGTGVLATAGAITGAFVTWVTDTASATEAAIAMGWCRGTKGMLADTGRAPRRDEDPVVDKRRNI